MCSYSQVSLQQEAATSSQTCHLITPGHATLSLNRYGPSRVCTILPFWPVTMQTRCLQVFENRQGLIVASFDTAAAADEGHLAAYMNELASLNSLTDEWQLSKVATGWALQHAGCTHFMLRPHWVPAVRCVAPQLAGLVPSVQVEAP